MFGLCDYVTQVIERVSVAENLHDVAAVLSVNRYDHAYGIIRLRVLRVREVPRDVVRIWIALRRHLVARYRLLKQQFFRERRPLVSEGVQHVLRRETVWIFLFYFAKPVMR